MNFQEWEQGVSEVVRSDALWKMRVYRLALFLQEVCWHDCAQLQNQAVMAAVAAQLYRAIGSIGANVAEGYSRNSGKDRARMYEYALGSARESRHWYMSAKFVLSPQVLQHRLDVLSEVIRLLLTIIPAQIGHNLHESATEYTVSKASDPQID